MTSATDALDWIRDGQRGLGMRAPEWLSGHRAEALEAFETLGFPTTRDESYRFTSVASVAAKTFALASPEAEGADALAAANEITDSAATVVVVNGCYDETLSAFGSLPLGVVVDGLANAFETADSSARDIALGLDYEGLPFAALNAAFLEDGVHVAIPEGAVLTSPIQVVVVTVPEDAPVMAHPRIVIEAGAQSQATVVLSFVGGGSQPYLLNAVTQVRLGAGAVLELVTDQRESEQANHVHHLHAVCETGALLHARGITLGGRLVRNDVSAVLEGEGAHATVDGVYLADGDELVDNHTSIDHAVAHCTSHELYKGILAGRGKAVFNGRILVRPDAQKTDAKMMTRALLLSDDAEADNKPELEIFADDVTCGHGATSGALDESLLFYLRARGLPEKDAQALLIQAFVGEAIESIASDALRDIATATAERWLEARS